MGSASWSQKKSKIPSVKTLNATILWTGDFSAVFEFTGPFGQLIKGEASQSEIAQKTEKKNLENCDVSAHFSEVVTRFTEKNEPAYRIFFQFDCSVEGQKRTTQTPAFFVRSKNLLAPTHRIHISEKMRTTQFFIKEFNL